MAEEGGERARLERRWALALAHRDRLLKVARSRTANAADAEDAVHEAMIRSVLFEDLDEERIGPFLVTVVSRLCVDSHRAGTQSSRLRERIGNRLLDEVSPEERLCEIAEARSVAYVVETLPARQQSVVRARSRGLSCTEIASRLGLSYTAVESALARARATVRAKVDICLSATAPGCLRLARALRAVPPELPGASAMAIGGLVGALIFVHPPALETRTETRAPGPSAVAERAPQPQPAPGPTGQPVPAPAAGVSRLGGALPVTPDDDRVPSPPYSPIMTIGDTGIVEPPDDRPFLEEVTDCVNEGIQVKPTIRCRQSQDDS